MNITILKVLSGAVICLLVLLCFKGGTGRYLILFVLFVLVLIFYLTTNYLGVVLPF